MLQTAETIPSNKRAFMSVSNDVVKSAAAVKLVYVTDSEVGFKRMRKGDAFIYMDGDIRLQDKLHLDRIRQLAIPPAWENVWICKKDNGHLQATGSDKLNRKQYQYHSRWNSLRNHTKFYRLLKFGQHLSSIRSRVQQDLALPGFPHEKVLAAVVSFLDRTNICVGNNIYEKHYGSFGLTTLKNRHVKINGCRISFSFKGKKGIRHNITLTSKKLSRIIKGCKDLPGKELFEYYDTDGTIRSVDSGMVNHYIQNLADEDFTAKDFRTWAGSVTALLAFREIPGFENVVEMKRHINAALDLVAIALGNTRAVCKKYYVHPLILDFYEKNKLAKYVGELKETGMPHEHKGLLPEEKLLLHLLEQY